MSATKREPPKKCSVLTIAGKDEPDMLHSLASLTQQESPGQKGKLNTAECVGHTLANRVILFAKLEGEIGALEALNKRAEERFRGDLHCHSEIVDDVEYMPGDMYVFPMRLRISSPDDPGILAAVTKLLADCKTHILSYRCERYSPARSYGMLVSEQTYVLKVPVEFDKAQFLAHLHEISDEHGFFSSTLEPL